MTQEKIHDQSPRCTWTLYRISQYHAQYGAFPRYLLMHPQFMAGLKGEPGAMLVLVLEEDMKTWLFNGLEIVSTPRVHALLCSAVKEF